MLLRNDVMNSLFSLSLLSILSATSTGDQPGVWVGCGEPGTPNNGNRFIVGKLQNESTYFCNKGGILIGSSLRTCLPNGTWSPQQIPRCVSNLAYNKIAQHQNFDVPKRGDSVDGIVTTCESQAGQFYGYIDLGKPIVFDNGIILVESTTVISISVFLTNDTSVTWPRFHNKNTLTNFCNVNNIRPTRSLICHHKEVARFAVIYLDKPASVCEVTVYNSKEETTCGQPDQPLHGRMKTRSSNSTTYECDPGYKIIGSSVTDCVNGTWNPKPPQCVQERTTLRPTWRPTSEITDYTTSHSQLITGNMTMGTMGIIVGATAVLCLASAILFYFCRRRYNKRRNRSQSTGQIAVTYKSPEHRIADRPLSAHSYCTIINEPISILRKDQQGSRIHNPDVNTTYDDVFAESSDLTDENHYLEPLRTLQYDYTYATEAGPSTDNIIQVSPTRSLTRHELMLNCKGKSTKSMECQTNNYSNM